MSRGATLYFILNGAPGVCRQEFMKLQKFSDDHHSKQGDYLVLQNRIAIESHFRPIRRDLSFAQNIDLAIKEDQALPKEGLFEVFVSGPGVNCPFVIGYFPRQNRFLLYNPDYGHVSCQSRAHFDTEVNSSVREMSGRLKLEAGFEQFKLINYSAV